MCNSTQPIWPIRGSAMSDTGAIILACLFIIMAVYRLRKLRSETTESGEKIVCYIIIFAGIAVLLTALHII